MKTPKVIKRIGKVFQPDIENEKDRLRKIFFDNAGHCKVLAENAYARTIGKPFMYKDLALLFQDEKMTTTGASMAVQRLSEFFYIRAVEGNRNEFVIVLDPVERVKMIEEFNRAKKESLEFMVENNQVLIDELEKEIK